MMSRLRRHHSNNTVGFFLRPLALLFLTSLLSSEIIFVLSIDQELVGISYCTYGPDYDCYNDGHPACCNDSTVECPSSQPECEINNNDNNNDDSPNIFEKEELLDGESYCTYGPDITCYENGHPACCNDDTLICPELQPECEIINDNFIVGDSYCTYGPDYDCYENGHPACCSDDTIECPAEQPVCEITKDNFIVGDSYCTYGPDYDCYENGHPACCSNDTLECPTEQPVCEINDDNFIVGDSYCTYGPDYTCYENGHPACCSDSTIECSPNQPECEINNDNPNIFEKEEEELDGGSYCTHSPDYTCYENGHPACCSDNTTECSVNQPECEINNDNPNVLGKEEELDGGSYCTYSPDYTCYENGHPACCSNSTLECPSNRPECESTSGGAHTTVPTFYFPFLIYISFLLFLK